MTLENLHWPCLTLKATLLLFLWRKEEKSGWNKPISGAFSRTLCSGLGRHRGCPHILIPDSKSDTRKAKREAENVRFPLASQPDFSWALPDFPFSPDNTGLFSHQMTLSFPRCQPPTAFTKPSLTSLAHINFSLFCILTEFLVCVINFGIKSQCLILLSFPKSLSSLSQRESARFWRITFCISNDTILGIQGVLNKHRWTDAVPFRQVSKFSLLTHRPVTTISRSTTFTKEQGHQKRHRVRHLPRERAVTTRGDHPRALGSLRWSQKSYPSPKAWASAAEPRESHFLGLGSEMECLSLKSQGMGRQGLWM